MILNNSMSLSNNGQNPIGDMRKNNPTKTEVALTVSATIAAINLRKLQHEYDRIAAQNDIVPDPNMSLAIESCIESIQAAITLNPTLSAISLDIATRVNNA